MKKEVQDGVTIYEGMKVTIESQDEVAPLVQYRGKIWMHNDERALDIIMEGPRKRERRRNKRLTSMLIQDNVFHLSDEKVYRVTIFMKKLDVKAAKKQVANIIQIVEKGGLL